MRARAKWVTSYRQRLCLASPGALLANTQHNFLSPARRVRVAHHHDRNAQQREVFGRVPQERIAIHHRHVQIEENERRRRHPAQSLQRLLPVGRPQTSTGELGLKALQRDSSSSTSKMRGALTCASACLLKLFSGQRSADPCSMPSSSAIFGKRA
jgi:hypothetical protein